jgi:hypothetical protein
MATHRPITRQTFAMIHRSQCCIMPITLPPSFDYSIMFPSVHTRCLSFIPHKLTCPCRAVFVEARCDHSCFVYCSASVDAQPSRDTHICCVSLACPARVDPYTFLVTLRKIKQDQARSNKIKQDQTRSNKVSTCVASSTRGNAYQSFMNERRYRAPKFHAALLSFYLISTGDSITPDRARQRVTDDEARSPQVYSIQTWRERSASCHTKSTNIHV